MPEAIFPSTAQQQAQGVLVSWRLADLDHTSSPWRTNITYVRLYLRFSPSYSRPLWSVFVVGFLRMDFVGLLHLTWNTVAIGDTKELLLVDE